MNIDLKVAHVEKYARHFAKTGKETYLILLTTLAPTPKFMRDFSFVSAYIMLCSLLKVN
jgi:hypothetical protein